LLNVSDRERVLSLIKTRFPEADPIDKILDWSLELAETRVLGMNLPNALGIEVFGDPELLVLENLLKGRSEEEINGAVLNTYPAEQADELLAALPAMMSKFHESILLGHLVK
jgi:hypothetical protein